MNGSLNELNGFYGYVIKRKTPPEAKKFIEDNAHYISNMICDIDRGGFDKRRDNIIVPANVLGEYKSEVLHFLETLKIKFPGDERAIDEFGSTFKKWDPQKCNVGDIDFMIRRLLLTVGYKAPRDEIKRMQLAEAIRIYRDGFGNDKVRNGIQPIVQKVFRKTVIDGFEIQEGEGYKSIASTGDFYMALRRALGFDNTKTRSKRR